MKGIMSNVMVYVFGVLALLVAASPLRDAITDAQTDTYAVLGAPATTRTYTLTDPHWHNDTTNMVVTSADDGDVTALCIVAASRVSVVCTGMTSATHAGTVAYITETTESTLNIVLKMIPFFLVLGIVVTSISYQGYQTYDIIGGGRGGDKAVMSILNSAIVILVMAILVPVLLAFVNMGRTEYNTQTDFIGMTVAWTLVLIGYVMFFLLAAFNAIAPQFQGRD